MYPAQKITLDEMPRSLLPDGIAELLTDVDTPRCDEPIAMIDDFGVQRVLDLTAMEEPTAFSKEDLNLKDQVESLERRLIERAVSESAGNIAEASRILGVKRTTLIEKMARLRIKKSSA
jgi:sigma-54 specific flagellar transcriptional regulator A